MPAKIRILSEQTINQIAAGEVIENPASVVKELVENAIDAGATQVVIEIFSGGFQGIKISDNGVGMSAEDALLALERHATSKIHSADDLFSLATMGFRGEALASIAAISKMTLTTAEENASATVVEVEGGKVLHLGVAARARGTTIEVRSLFHNVPARKKFQKSIMASSAEITRVVTQLALAHPETGIELLQQGRSVFSLPAAQEKEDFILLLKRRAGQLLGEEFLGAAYELKLQKGEYAGCGLIADPLHSRPNRSGQYLFVNRRPVFCLPIAYAVRDAYGTRLASDRHPMYLLHLSIPSACVDVNVHPQKKEIRLREEGLLKYALHKAVNEALGGMEAGMPEISVQIPPWEAPAFEKFTEPVIRFQEEQSALSEPELPLEKELTVIGLYGNYALVEAQSLPSSLLSSSGVVWFDLSSVETRLQFDLLVHRAEAMPLSQGLLMPITLPLSRAEVQLLNAHLETVQKLGLQVRPIGETAVMVEAIPPFLEENEMQKTLEELIEELQGKERGIQKMLHRLASSLSQRVRLRKRPYTEMEARQLIEKLVRSDDPYRCPQGQATFFVMQEEEIENSFKRSPFTRRSSQE